METNPTLIGTCVLSQQVSENTIAAALPTVFKVTESYIILAKNNGDTHVFDINGIRKKVLSNSRGAVWALAVRGDMLASGGTDNSIEIWDVATG